MKHAKVARRIQGSMTHAKVARRIQGRLARTPKVERRIQGTSSPHIEAYHVASRCIADTREFAHRSRSHRRHAKCLLIFLICTLDTPRYLREPPEYTEGVAEGSAAYPVEIRAYSRVLARTPKVERRTQGTSSPHIEAYHAASRTHGVSRGSAAYPGERR